MRGAFYTMRAMRRTLATLTTALVSLAVLAPSALAIDGGQGTYGEAGDKVVTNAGFILIGAFPLLIFALSLLQWSLDRRKDRRKAAAKARNGRIWQGGW
jgi:hypothetical protein